MICCCCWFLSYWLDVRVSTLVNENLLHKLTTGFHWMSYVVSWQADKRRCDTHSLVLLPSVECRREAEESAQADRHEQRAEDRHHSRQGQTPLGLDHVDLACGGGRRHSEQAHTQQQQEPDLRTYGLSSKNGLWSGFTAVIKVFVIMFIIIIQYLKNKTYFCFPFVLYITFLAQVLRDFWICFSFILTTLYTEDTNCRNQTYNQDRLRCRLM